MTIHHSSSPRGDEEMMIHHRLEFISRGEKEVMIYHHLLAYRSGLRK